MKKIKALLFLLLICSALLIFAACGQTGDIKYVYNCDEALLDAQSPSLPKREGYIFAGWFTDEELTEPYNIGSFSGGRLTLYAKWERDAASIIEVLSKETARACLKISAEYYSSAFFPSAKSQGSGVIYKEDKDYYYLLTNNHVVVKEKPYARCVYKLYDVFDNVYEGELLASDALYDLAVIRIRKLASSPLLCLELDSAIPEKNETVISLTSPEGQKNVISFGEIINYETIENPEASITVSNVTFDVYWTTAEASSGSSGGALISEDFKLLGINYAVGKDEDGSFLYSFAIPAAKVLEFLETVNLQ